jgi:hypothetical protein
MSAGRTPPLTFVPSSAPPVSARKLPENEPTEVWIE